MDSAMARLPRTRGPNTSDDAKLHEDTVHTSLGERPRPVVAATVAAVAFASPTLAGPSQPEPLSPDGGNPYEMPPDGVSTAASSSDDGFSTGDLLRSWRARNVSYTAATATASPPEDFSTADSNSDGGFSTGGLLRPWHAGRVAAGSAACVAAAATVADIVDVADPAAATIAGIVDVADGQHSVAAMLRWKRRRSVEEVEEEIAKFGFPIELQLSYTAQDCKAKLLGICERAAQLHQPVYVGTTENVRRRWNGVNKEEFEAWRAANPGKKVREPLKKGHRRLYSRMIVIAHAPMRTHAYYLEPYFIDLARRCCGKFCINKVSDARGMSSEPQLLYIVVDESGTALDAMKAGDRGLKQHAQTQKKSPFAFS
jgi:hypothetical protein